MQLNFSKIISAFSIIFLFFSCSDNQEDLNKKLHGLWRLDKYETLDSASGSWISDTTRAGYSGYILYDGMGHMAIHLLLKPGYKDFNANKNPDSLDISGLKEFIGFYKANYVYFADYKIDGDTIVHNKLSATNPKEWATTARRGFEFSDDTLILTPGEKITGKTLRLRWIKERGK